MEDRRGPDRLPVRTVEGVTIRRGRHAVARVAPREWPHRTTVEHTFLDLAGARGPDRAIALAAKAVWLALTTPGRRRSALAQRPGDATAPRWSQDA